MTDAGTRDQREKEQIRRVRGSSGHRKVRAAVCAVPLPPVKAKKTTLDATKNRHSCGKNLRRPKLCADRHPENPRYPEKRKGGPRGQQRTDDKSRLRTTRGLHSKSFCIELLDL